ncbi:glycoside hydrolase family 13 protein [Demequina sp.]|uniref:glycoside hydrolase family 13 protein n=1 Tax=Demequina sp. TaxID=2050685 RepID=UPI0025E535C9|nr:glycoside hydrolase family 13 protein [Demequina sp.]
MIPEPSGTTSIDPHWWRQAVVYQVYPRSFADSNADGLGDLPGITGRVQYLRSLSVDAVWLSPFYPSALADGGYDVDNYRDVDPRLGTLADFDALVAALHDVGIRIFVDIVPNHSSDRHEWFRAALDAAPGSAERERYIFRDGRGDHGELPPNDWPGHFGPSSWTRTTGPDGTPGQWYLHLFAPEQPDLNWDNPEVHADFITTLRFWADRGVDGFRVDAAHLLKKDLSEPYRPVETISEVSRYPTDGSHPLLDRDEVHDIYRTWRSVFDEYSPPRVAVAEAGAPPSRRGRYASAEELGQAFNFELLEAQWDARDFRETIETCLATARASDSSSTWTLSNHDVVRVASRFGLPNGTDLNQWLLSAGTEPVADAARGLRRARAAMMLMLALPGSAYLFQGEELGLPEVPDLPPEVLRDPIWLRDAGARKGRDGCRVPLPWAADGPSFGFGANGAHLPMPAWFGDYAVDKQDGAGGSTLELYRAALRTRRALQSTESLEWHEGPDDVVWFSRDNGWHSFTNFGLEPAALPAGEVLLSSAALHGQQVPGETTVWFRV